MKVFKKYYTLFQNKKEINEFKLLNKEEVIKEFVDVHGDTYDYTKFHYKNGSIKGEIVCKVENHGSFYQSAASHINKNGCPKCGKIKRGLSQRINIKNKMLAKFNLIHGNKYNYDKFDFDRVNSKSIILCKEKNHGEFKQSYAVHVRGHGCPKCALIIKSIKMKTSLKKVLIDFRKVHGNKYIYSQINENNYLNMHTKVTVICKKHGPFEIRPSEHKRGSGCQKCGRENSSSIKVLKDVIKDFKIIHGNQYDYSSITVDNYVNMKTNVIIICKKHGPFPMKPTNHKRGYGCQACAETGFNPLKPGLLYYIRINKDGLEAYKIGITNNTLKDRFREDLKNISKIKIVKYEYGQEALEAEKKILSEFKFAKWTGPDLLKTGGNTEMFKYDVLNLDSERAFTA